MGSQLDTWSRGRIFSSGWPLVLVAPCCSPLRVERGLGGPWLYTSFLATLPCDLLSAFLAFCNRPVYPCYLSTTQLFSLSTLQDQECAGALMWGLGNVRVSDSRSRHHDADTLASQ